MSYAALVTIQRSMVKGAWRLQRSALKTRHMLKLIIVWWLCSVPFSLWVGSLFVATLSYYTSDYMRQGQDAPEKRNERYVYDPTAGVHSTSSVDLRATKLVVWSLMHVLKLFAH